MFERTDIRILRSDGRAYTGSGNECSFCSETVSCETAEGFKISARLLPDSPLMKAQSGFSRDCAKTEKPVVKINVNTATVSLIN